MLKFDLSFNALMIVVDLLLIAVAVEGKRRGLGALVRGICIGVIFLIPLFLAVTFAQFFNLRSFAVMRWVGMGAFWHLPASLAVLIFMNRRTMRVAVPLAASGASLLGFYIWTYHIEPYRLEVTHYEFRDPRLNGLRRPIVIAQIADVQTDRVGEYERRVFARLAELKPDMIVYCGDYLHMWRRGEYAPEARRLRAAIAAAHLDPPLGSYAVIGDVDVREDWREVFKDLPVHLLSDRTEVVNLPGCKVNLIGLDVHTSRTFRTSELRRAGAGSDPDALDIYLGHSPDFATALESAPGRFLAFAGHTHGGQVQLPFIGPIMTLIRLPKRYADGFLPYGPGVVSVSRGIGMERYDAPRLRFLCRPELRLVTLRGEGEQE
ncbi:hypothetical protein HY256_12110 [Candidatus Sumerlaeota bacterium]|nr:hypothetical protein [Candidatus Sumerlaeota bacterium]